MKVNGCQSPNSSWKRSTHAHEKHLKRNECARRQMLFQRYLCQTTLKCINTHPWICTVNWKLAKLDIYLLMFFRCTSEKNAAKTASVFGHLCKSSSCPSAWNIACTLQRQIGRCLSGPEKTQKSFGHKVKFSHGVHVTNETSLNSYWSKVSCLLATWWGNVQPLGPRLGFRPLSNHWNQWLCVPHLH